VLDIDPEPLGCCFDPFDRRPMDCIAWVPDNSDPAEGRNHFLKKLDPRL